MIFVDDPIII